MPDENPSQSQSPYPTFFGAQTPAIHRNRFKVVSLLNRSSFGSTYKAEDLRVPGYFVVIKEIIEVPQQASHPLGESIKEELQLIHQMSEKLSFIPDIFDHWSTTTNDGSTTYYIVRDFIEGESLDRLQALPWSIRRVEAFLYTLLRDLDSLHRGGFIHRDIKPANIIKTERGYTLLDFGMPQQSSAPLTVTGFTAPEQLFVAPSIKVDQRADLFSLGATTFFLLTSRSPTLTNTSSGSKTLELSNYLEQVPIGLRQTLLEMLDVDPNRRPSSAREAIERLRLRSVEEIADATNLTTSLNLILSQSGPRQSLMLRRCAIPRWFDLSILAVLREREDGGQQVIAALADYSFVRLIGQHAYTYHNDARAVLLQTWRNESREEWQRIHRILTEYAARRQQAADSIDEQRRWLWEALYHQILAEPEVGRAQLLQARAEATKVGDIAALDALRQVEADVAADQIWES